MSGGNNFILLTVKNNTTGCPLQKKKKIGLSLKLHIFPFSFTWPVGVRINSSTSGKNKYCVSIGGDLLNKAPEILIYVLLASKTFIRIPDFPASVGSPSAVLLSVGIIL